MPLISPAEPRDLLPGMLRSRAEPMPAATAAARPPDMPALDLDDVLRVRRSTREFTAEPVSRDELSAIVSTASGISARQWPANVHGAVSPSIVVAAARVIGLPTGMYAASCNGALTTMRASSADGPAGVHWQPELHEAYAASPVTLLICGDVVAAASARGSGYASLLVRAGALGHAAWLAAISHGLAGSVYGGSLPAATQAARRCLGAGVRHLFTVALGHPRERSAEGGCG